MPIRVGRLCAAVAYIVSCDPRFQFEKAKAGCDYNSYKITSSAVFNVDCRIKPTLDGDKTCVMSLENQSETVMKLPVWCE